MFRVKDKVSILFLPLGIGRGSSCPNSWTVAGLNFWTVDSSHIFYKQLQIVSSNASVRFLVFRIFKVNNEPKPRHHATLISFTPSPLPKPRKVLHEIRLEFGTHESSPTAVRVTLVSSLCVPSAVELSETCSGQSGQVDTK